MAWEALVESLDAIEAQKFGGGARVGSVAEAFSVEGGDEPNGARQPAEGGPQSGRGGAREPL